MINRKLLILTILIALILVMPFQNVVNALNSTNAPNSLNAKSNEVLLVYAEKEEMQVIANLIKACSMTPVPVNSVEYSSEMIENYEYIVLQDATPLKDVLQSGKRPICLGDNFNVIPGAQTDTISRKMRAELSVYNNTQSIFLDKGFSYISDYNGETFGSISFDGKTIPLGIMTDNILFAPYFSKDDISVFAVAKMFNRYFEMQDGGKMYVMIDEVYPFDDIEMLELSADKFYEAGIPFVMSIMPVYSNTDYPSFKRYAKALRYIQSRGCSLVMHEPIFIEKNELVGDDIDVRMENAYKNFEENGVYVFSETIFSYEISLDVLMSIEPQNELFIDFPIDTVIKYKVFNDESELNDAVEAINKKWFMIGDYRRNFTDNIGNFLDTEEDSVYVYREKTEASFLFLVNSGNRVLTIFVLISAVIIIALIIIGYGLYRQKFIKGNE